MSASDPRSVRNFGEHSSIGLPNIDELNFRPREKG